MKRFQLGFGLAIIMVGRCHFPAADRFTATG